MHERLQLVVNPCFPCQHTSRPVYLVLCSDLKARMENQTRLSEYLRVLQHLGYSHPSTRSNSAHRDRKTDEEIRILDTLAVALTSGTRGEVIATSFNKREPVTLLLAKNTPCDATDREAVQELVKRITSPQTQNFENVLPFLFVHCKVNMMNRISKLLKALKEFRSDLQTILGIHGPFSSLAEEFPGSEEYRAWKYGQRVPSFSEMLHDLLEDIQETARTLNIENPGQPSVDLFCDPFSHPIHAPEFSASASEIHH